MSCSIQQMCQSGSRFPHIIPRWTCGRCWAPCRRTTCDCNLRTHLNLEATGIAVGHLRDERWVQWQRVALWVLKNVMKDCKTACDELKFLWVIIIKLGQARLCDNKRMKVMNNLVSNDSNAFVWLPKTECDLYCHIEYSAFLYNYLIEKATTWKRLYFLSTCMT